MKDLAQKIQQFVEERDWDRFHSPKNLAMALSVEAAEVVEHFQWLTEAESMELPDEKRAEIRDELGDVLIYLVQLSRKLGIDLVDAAHRKVDKNALKYPKERVRGKALKYSEYKESFPDRHER
ncbi:MAG: nucleotide pyrophosphohydrolase [Nitrospirae bacterium CG_4_9_14_3_um_filter_53_35]|nr:nucleotide pyrophosphohydrolase [Deltaproteobacteria bacterium]OIP62165.1 MAG: nucleotide pyrophosphohydrolase [Nitrospirae bacterium CG2_30_53_67]PIS38257.1 MAG: nucleotide pyrophosphohydrolase [Nitrospirae bacterium CG08_land_8_20_14_0_20_52_24]PIV83484.1 MAG: nucleotide pyrophosphohydrolase [Nitrospirae bacterium CG17_big_fil_post_rev_8_21_14_2_50_50_9]PIX86444.1 MAG: nucleotide pyrophosphohydrolase [Nitrospirae bacterium CG_4_10_14_3_um_filter_53_41]PJA74543.1 MAG: nucleotide pyrophosph